MKDKAQIVTGGCHCGAVRYEAEVFLHSAYYCHCTTCQDTSGAPAEIGIPVKVGSLQFTEEEPRYYTSSDWAKRGFCQHCGSRIIFMPLATDNEWLINLAVGSLDNPDRAKPSMHIYVESQLPWYNIDEDLPRFRADELDDLLPVWKEERLRDV
jgi:hypothetical protein